MKRSIQLVRGRFVATLVRLLLLFGTIFLIGAVVGTAFDLLSKSLLALAGWKMILLVPTAAVLLLLHLLVVAGLSFVGISMYCTTVTRLYFKAAGGIPDSIRKAVAADASSPKSSGTRIRITGKRRTWIAAIILLGVVAGVSLFLVNSLNVEDQVKVTAHRGGAHLAPENSLAALRNAIEIGADYAEIDVQETADGVIVVLHDEDLMKVGGLNKKIWEVGYDDIRDLDAGSWFGEEFKDERIPTLQQAIGLARGKITLYIELKFNGHDVRLVERVADIIRENNFEDECIVASLNYDALQDVKRHLPGVPVGYFVFEAVGDVSRLDVDFLSVASKLVTPKLLRHTRSRGKELHTWTINDRAGMTTMINLGVDNIITDVPDVLTALLEERAAMTDIERLLLIYQQWLAW